MPDEGIASKESLMNSFVVEEKEANTLGQKESEHQVDTSQTSPQEEVIDNICTQPEDHIPPSEDSCTSHSW